MDSNHGQGAYETPALPPELHRRSSGFVILKDYNNIVNKKRFILDKNDTISV